MLDIQIISTTEFQNTMITKVQNQQKGTNGNLFLKKNFTLNKKLFPLNTNLKKIEKKD